MSPDLAGARAALQSVLAGVPGVTSAHAYAGQGMAAMGTGSGRIAFLDLTPGEETGGWVSTWYVAVGVPRDSPLSDQIAAGLWKALTHAGDVLVIEAESVAVGPAGEAVPILRATVTIAHCV